MILNLDVLLALTRVRYGMSWVAQSMPFGMESNTKSGRFAVRQRNLWPRWDGPNLTGEEPKWWPPSTFTMAVC